MTALDGVLGAIEAAHRRRGAGRGRWSATNCCCCPSSASGSIWHPAQRSGDTDDLAWVSPKSGQAVSRAAGAPYADRLLPLPRFLLAGGEAGWGDVRDALRLTGFFLERDLLLRLPARACSMRASGW